jgi:hypothetical protein
MNNTEYISLVLLILSVGFFTTSVYKKLNDDKEAGEGVTSANIFLICSVVLVFISMAIAASSKTLKRTDIFNIIIICLAILSIILLSFEFNEISIFFMLLTAIFGTAQFLFNDTN